MTERTSTDERIGGYRHGYVRGYEAAIAALDALLLGADTAPERALKYADDHLLDQLEEWLEDVDIHAPPPEMGAGTRHSGGLSADAVAATGDDRGFRRGYVDGWDAALDAMTFLLLGCHAARAAATARARAHVHGRLRPWRDRPGGEPPVAPPLLYTAEPATTSAGS